MLVTSLFQCGNRLAPICALAATLLLAGCTSGRDFKMPAQGELKLGETTPSEAIALLGQPLSRSSQSTTAGTPPSPAYQELRRLMGQSVFVSARETGTYERFSYSFSDNSGQQLIGRLSGVRPARTLRLLFWNGKLSEYVGISSFQADSTNFEESKLAQIERDKSSEADVIALLGKPTGGSSYPMISSRKGHALIYDYAEVDLKENQRNTKFLTIFVDEEGIVREVQANSASNPLPPPPPGPATVTVPVYIPPPKK